MHFTKMEGLGNDYLYMYGSQEEIDSLPTPALSRRWSDRHFGIGSDGIIQISPSDQADFRMRIYNADGSEAMMCGNGIRCVGKYVHDKGYTQKTHLTVDTRSGIKTLDLNLREDGTVASAAVDMGQVKVSYPESVDLENGTPVILTPVNVGNPHAVIFVSDAEAADVAGWGPELEHHPLFPEGVNVEFAQVLDEHTIRMRVWERGSGITMACGTGACATAAAAAAQGKVDGGHEITIRLDGGDLSIRVFPDQTVVMTGPCAFVSECDVIEEGEKAK